MARLMGQEKDGKQQNTAVKGENSIQTQKCHKQLFTKIFFNLKNKLTSVWKKVKIQILAPKTLEKLNRPIIVK